MFGRLRDRFMGQPNLPRPFMGQQPMGQYPNPVLARSSLPGQPGFFDKLKTLSKDEAINYSMMVIGVLLLIFASIYIIWMYVEKYRDIRNILTTPVVAINNGISIKAADFPTTIPDRGIKFTLSMWIYVTDWMANNGKDKDIFRKGDFRIYLHKDTNNLMIDVPMYPVEKAKADSKSTISTMQTLTFVDFPLQKWVNVVVVVDGRSIDLWINGKMYQSLNLPNIIFFTNVDNVYMIAKGVAKYQSSNGTITKITSETAGGYNGYLAGVSYYKYPLQREEIVNTFERGPYPTNFVNKYAYRLLQYLFMTNIPIQMSQDIQYSQVGKSSADVAALQDFVESNGTAFGI